MPRCTEIEENTKALAQRSETMHSELLKWVNTTTLKWLSPCVGNDNVSSVLKSYQKENYNRTNIIQRDWARYTSSNQSDLHKRFCGEWLVMRVGVGKHAIEPQLLTSRGSKTRPLQLLVIPFSHFF